MSGLSEQASLPGFEVLPSPPGRIKAPHARDARHGLFFAIMPALSELPRVEAAAVPLRQRHGVTSGPVRAERLHVTCCDLGSFRELPPQDLINAAMTVAASLALPSFQIDFGRVMRFRGNEALVLLENEGATPLTLFRCALDEALVRAHVPVNFAGTLHMTLAYGGGGVSEPLAELVHWVAQDFVLIHSLVGQGQHRHLGRWSLLPWR